MIGPSSSRNTLLSEHLDYWKQRLSGAPVVLELPIDHPRSSSPVYHRGTYLFALSKNLSDRLKKLSDTEDVSLYVLLLAAFNILLHRYTRQEDILVGMMGEDHFSNVLVLRTHLEGHLTFRELLSRVCSDVSQAYAHQHVPLKDLVEALRPEEATDRSPFFQVLLTLDSPLAAVAQRDAQWDTLQLDLSINLVEQPDALTGSVIYNTDLFEESTIIRMLGHWQTLLEGVVADPTQCLAELPLLTEKERHQLLVEWNATQVAYPKDTCVHQLFEAQVERTPEAVAVVFEGEQLTYQELNRRANQLAHHLQHLGVGPNVLVGICVGRSLDMVVALLGVLKAGGAYVPLDPAYPQDRLAFTLQDAHATVLLTQQELVERLPRCTASVICLDTDWGIIARESDENVTSEATSETLAYVIYTSGSTGRPKGVAIAHRSTAAFTQWAMTIFTPEDLDGVLASTSICFDLSVFELFVPLSSGGTVILAQNVLHLPSLSGGKPVTLLNTVPSAAAELVRSNSIPASVHTVNLAGEPLHNTLVQRLYQQDTIQRVFNLYGPTEDTTYSTYVLAEKGEREPSIGRPIANTQVYILNAHLQPVPIRVAGELYLGGEGLARGYLNRPDLTAERFIPNPFSPAPGARLYKTGDLARYLPDGNIEFLGRIDHQVKIRGFRIELGEIEAVLRNQPEVQEAVVVAREDSPGDKHLVAYIVADKGQPPTIANLRRSLREKVPEYMVPSAFVVLDALPLTPNGKVDRRALPAPETTTRTSESPYVAPTSQVQHQLVRIWEELLHVRPIGIKDDFLALGGHSLLAARTVKRIERECDKKIAVSALLSAATIEQVAAMLTREEMPGHASAQVPVVTLQAEGSRHPFFYLHGDWQGRAFYCLQMSRELGSDQPFHLLESYRVDDLGDLPTIETIAQASIESMRAVQPEGPYLLGGYCNGAMIAYEMACQLHEQGQRVDLLLLIHPASLTPRSRAYELIRRAGRLLHLRREKQIELFLLYFYLKEEKWKAYRLRRACRGVWNLTVRADDAEDDEGCLLMKLTSILPRREDLRQYWNGQYEWIALRHVPRQYPGKVTFIWAGAKLFNRRHWLKLTQGYEIEEHVIAGSDLRIENLPSLARQVKHCLNALQEVP